MRHFAFIFLLFICAIGNAQQIGIYPQVTASGPNTYTASITSPKTISSYTTGERFQVKFTNANTSTATLNINAIGAISIVKNGSTALSSGDIPANSIKILVYDGTNLQIIGDGTGSAATTWGSITGTLSSQTDLQTAIDGKVADAINNGTTTIAPSQNAVFDALALKRDKASSLIYCAALSDNTTALTTGTNKGFLPIPIGGTVTAVYAYVLTAQTSGSVLTVDINEAGTSILGTKITLDNNETDNTTAATAATITDTSIANHARITFDIDQVGTSPAGLVGCIVLTPQ
jgi:hypothetical protein